MKKFVLFSLLFGMHAGSLLAHRHEVEVVPEYVYVEMEPPADIAEEVGTSPGAGYIWIKGHWAWQNRWKWEKGAWILKPHETANWNPGYWKSKHHHWVWTPGYWS